MSDTDDRLQALAPTVVGYLRNITTGNPNELAAETVAACAGMIIESFAIRNRELREERDRLQALINDLNAAYWDGEPGRALEACLDAATAGSRYGDDCAPN